jgi:hypothetical protein
MKKKWPIIFLVLTLLIAVIVRGAITGESITGESITGEATSQSLSMNITVRSPAFPTLTIISPENKTYLTNLSLLLNYTTVNAETVWYSLDGGETNITITDLTYFNTSQGSQTLSLYANNTYGNTSVENVIFTANSTRFVILYEEYKESTRGDSTDFILYAFEDIQNMSDIVLENTDYGKILFRETINLTADSTPIDNLLDLDTYTQIEDSTIELNSSILTNFNIEATLWFYNLGFSNPRILKEGAVCPASVCTRESYSGGILKFNVTEFGTSYSVEETPGDVTPETPGGGGFVKKEIDFEVIPELTKATIKKGEIYKAYLTVTNTGETSQNFKLNMTALDLFLEIPETEFSLNPEEEKKVLLIFSSPEDIKEDTYLGKIKIYTLDQEKDVPVILGIESRALLFDITLNIPANYKEVQPGEDVLFQLSLFNLVGTNKTDVEIDYYIRDFEGQTLVKMQEVMTVETRTSFSRTMKVPSDTKDSQYVIVANVRYASSVGTSSDVFNVGRVELAKRNRILQIIIIIVAILAILIIILTRSHFKGQVKKVSKTYKKEISKIETKIKKGHVKRTEADSMGRKLNRQLVLLNRAYANKYISKKSYEAGKGKIKRTRNSLKRKYL